MHRFLPLLVLLAWLVSGNLALSESEAFALRSLTRRWPSLTTLKPQWSLDTSSACVEPFWQGLNCSEGNDPHVIGLYGLPPVFAFIYPTITMNASILHSSEYISYISC
jgi:hypothetical protein